MGLTVSRVEKSAPHCTSEAKASECFCRCVPPPLLTNCSCLVLLLLLPLLFVLFCPLTLTG